MKTFTIEVSGKTQSDIVNAINEISKLVETGNLAGFDENETGNFNFDSENEYGPSQDEIDEIEDSYSTLFVKWAIINHGDHPHCDVATALNTDPTSNNFITNLIKAVEDSEGVEWHESWEQFLNDHKKTS